MEKLTEDNQPTQEKFYSEKDKATNQKLNFEITDDFQRFNGCNTVFARVQWDKNIRSQKGIDYFKSLIGYPTKIKKTDGYQQKDFALRNASWVIANLMIERSLHLDRHDGFLDSVKEYRPIADTKVEVNSATEMSFEIKKITKIFGGDLVGITNVDMRWHYTHRFNAKNMTEKESEFTANLKHCIVVGVSMPYEVVETYPSALAGIAPGFGYSKESVILQTVSQYIRNLGYDAMSALSDTAQTIPYAIQAGLGEYARNGLVITKEFGPRIRFGLIFTDLPLIHDQQVKLGVKEFCKICSKCADACPAKAISFDEPTVKIHNQSNIVGVKKWTVNGEKCFNIWANQGTECGICIRVCPYNKDNKTKRNRIYFRLFRYLAASPLKRITLKIDNFLGYGKRKSPSSWWKKTIT